MPSVVAQELSLNISRSTAAALYFLAYDICLTTDLEITYIWRTPWASAKPFYFIARYYSLVALIVKNSYQFTCREWIVFESISVLILELSVQILLMLRLFAMYLGSKTTMRLMVVPFVIQAIAMIVCIGLSVPHILTSPGCIEARVPVTLVVYCIVSVVFESYLFALTISRYRRAQLDGMANIGLMSVLVRDGVLAFAVIFVAMVTNAILFTVSSGQNALTTAGFPWLLAVLGSAGSRLVLNVRESSRKQPMPTSLDDLDMNTAVYRAVGQRDADDYGTDDDTLELKEARKSSFQTDQIDTPQSLSFERRPLAC